MSRTVLVGAPQFSWRAYLKDHRGGRDLVILDPADADIGTPGRLSLYHGSKLVDWTFFGALDVLRNPIAWMAGAIRLLAQASEDALVLFFPFQPSPAARQLALQMCQLIQPAEILIPEGAKLQAEPWPIGPEAVTLEPDFPDMVKTAQRRARWIEMLEQCEDHVIPLDEVDFMFSRFGGGRRVPAEYFDRAGVPGVLWAERTGRTLLVVSRQAFSDEQVSSLVNVGHATKLVQTDPIAFSGLLCSLSRQDGEELGMGMIEEVSFTDGVIRARCRAVPPAPVRVLKIGQLRIDALGRELHEIKPWSI